MPGPRITTVFRGLALEIEAEYEPGYPPDNYDPGQPECVDVGGIFAEDGITPVMFSDKQIDALEEQLLAEMHAERNYNRYLDHVDRENHYDPRDVADRCP